MRIPTGLLLGVLVAGCSDGAGPDQVGRDSADAGIFARIDGLPWGADVGPMDTIGTWNIATVLRIQGEAMKGNATTILALDLGFAGTPIRTPRSWPLVPTSANYNIWPQSGGISVFEAMHGRFTIISYDSATQYLVGTFKFTAVRTDGPSTQDSVIVDHGTFRGFIRTH